LLLDAFGALERSAARRIASYRAVLLTTTAIAVSVVYGRYCLSHWSDKSMHGPSYSIAAVQEDPSYVDSIQKMRAATDALQEPFDLVCWPESTLGTLSTDLVSLADTEAVLNASMPPKVDVTPMIGLTKPLIAGGRSFDGLPSNTIPQHQTAFVIDSTGGVLGHYHKRRLMPLGEYVPGETRWSWLHDWFQLNEYIIPGTQADPILMPDQARVGILVCFEDIIPEVARTTVECGAEVLVCIINASAFENSVALEQHMHLARLRAIENRRHLVRVAGTGVTCVIGPSGEIAKSVDVLSSSAFVAKAERISTLTLFTRLGNWTPWAALLTLGCFFASPRAKQRKLFGMSS
jgi:apolipoprotein N-acyltransferase